LIFNDLYVDRIVWNKVRTVKNPDTGKRISRPNARDQRQTIDTPHLRIVDDQTRKQARRLKAEKANLKLHMKR
jgi:site-specific DNA recombinase